MKFSSILKESKQISKWLKLTDFFKGQLVPEKKVHFVLKTHLMLYIWTHSKITKTV